VRANTIIAAATFMVTMAGCVALPQKTVEPEEQFGHRVPGTSEDGRVTISIDPPDEEVEYRFFDAVYEDVVFRPAPVSTENVADGVSVEVLVKGAFPDSCSELHDVSQQRNGHVVDATLVMRRPSGSVCATVLRPYRFYMMLEGDYTPGSYTVKLNGRTHTFVVSEPRS